MLNPVDVTELPADVVAENRSAWLAALESGNYPQGRGALYTGVGYCCLGVAEDARGADWHEDAVPNRRLRFVDDAGAPLCHDDLAPPVTPIIIGSEFPASTVLSADGARWLGVRDLDPSVVVWDDEDEDDPGWTFCTLSTLNDDRKFTFVEIAAVLRDQSSDWNGRSRAVAREAERRDRQRVPRPAYARVSR